MIMTQTFKVVNKAIALILYGFSTMLYANPIDYPGEMINVGTHRLHIYCIGQGTPTVILESGIGGFSAEWFTVQQSLAQHVRVCSYDRAGYGWSEFSPQPRTVNNLSTDLHDLLVMSNNSPPYVIVAHSFGAYNALNFSYHHSQWISGIVLLDGSHPDQFSTEAFKQNKYKLKSNPNNLIRRRVIRAHIPENYPPQTRDIAAMLMSTLKFSMAIKHELDFFEFDASQLQFIEPYDFDFPITIVSRGKHAFPKNKLGIQREIQWQELQQDLTTLSTNSNRLIAINSGHVIHLDEPNFVAEAVLDIIADHQKQ